MESRPVFENYLLKSWTRIRGRLSVHQFKRRIKTLNILASQPCEVKLDKGKSSVQVRIEVSYRKRLSDTVESRDRGSLDGFVECETASKNDVCWKGFRMYRRVGVGHVLCYNEEIIAIMEVSDFTFLKDRFVLFKDLKLYILDLGSLNNIREEHNSDEKDTFDLMKYDPQPLKIPIKENGPLYQFGSNVVLSGTEEVLSISFGQEINQKVFLVSPFKRILSEVLLPPANTSTYIIYFHPFKFRAISCILGITLTCGHAMLAVHRDQLHVVSAPKADFLLFDKMIAQDSAIEFIFWSKESIRKNRYSIELCCN